MQSGLQIGVVVVAAGGAAMTFVVARQAIRAHSAIGNSSILAGCCAVMSFGGMLAAGPVIVIGFAALGFACLAIPVVRFFVQQGAFRSHSPSEDSTPTLPIVQLPHQSPRRQRRPPAPAAAELGLIPLDIKPQSGEARDSSSRSPGTGDPSSSNNHHQ